VLSVFPLLLVLFTVLGLLFSHDPGLQHRVIHSALSQFPVVGKQLDGHDGITELREKGLGLALGLVTLFWGSIGVTRAGQRAMADVWNVPQLNRPHSVRRVGRSVEFLGVLVLDVVLSTALAGLVTFDPHAVWIQTLAVIVGLAINVALFLLGFEFSRRTRLPPRRCSRARSSPRWDGMRCSTSARGSSATNFATRANSTVTSRASWDSCSSSTSRPRSR